MVPDGPDDELRERCRLTCFSKGLHDIIDRSYQKVRVFAAGISLACYLHLHCRSGRARSGFVKKVLSSGQRIGKRIMRWMFIKIVRILWFAVLTLAMVSCVKAHKSRLHGLSENLSLVGAVQLPDGGAAAGVAVYIESDADAATTTDEAGNFTIELRREKLVLMRGDVFHDRDIFFLYFETSSPSVLKGISPQVAFNDGGTVNLGTIKLAAPVTIEGVVKKLPKGQSIQPGANASIKLGRQTLLAKEDGTFRVESVASAGNVPLMVSLKDFIPHMSNIDAVKVSQSGMEEPIVLFPEQGVTGALLPVAPDKYPRTLAGDGHPFLRKFIAKKSLEAKWLRFHHDPEVINALNERSQQELDKAASVDVDPKNPTADLEAPLLSDESKRNLTDGFWYPADKPFEYDFPTGNGQVLYYQFANEEKTDYSPIYQITVSIDIFYDTTGIVIANNNGLVTSALAQVKVDVPNAAVRMRLGEKIDDFEKLPWQEVRETVPYPFQPYINEASQRTLFCQFIDAFGNLSPVFSSTVSLDLFTSPGPVIEGISPQGVITTPYIQVTTHRPPNAVKMRMADNFTKIEESPWMEARDRTDFLFTPRADELTRLLSVSGIRQFRIQYMDSDGFISKVYTTTAQVEMYPVTQVPFMINGGSPVAYSLQALLEINVPPNAYEMRVVEPDNVSSAGYSNVGGLMGGGYSGSMSSTRNSIWTRVTPAYPYLFQSDGMKEVYLQFRDINGFVSSMYKQSIVVAPLVSPGVIDNLMILNAPLGIVRDPELHLSFSAPPGAVSVVFSQAQRGQQQSPNAPRTFSSLQNQIVFPLTGQPGETVIYMQFLDAADNQIGPTISRVVLYQPFEMDNIFVDINAPGGTVSSVFVNVDIAFPSRASSMRVSHDPVLIQSLPFTALKDSIYYELPPLSGRYKIYVQFANDRGEMSVLYFDDIRLAL
jgi:hypothetical protein